MKKQKKQRLVLMFIIGLLLISGCSKESEVKKVRYKENTESIVYKNKDKIEVDKEMTEKIRKEKIVQDGNVYSHGEDIVATMILKRKTKKDDYLKVANKYFDILKKDSKANINVQAVLEGKNVVNLTSK